MTHKHGTPNCKPQVARDLIERNKNLSDPMSEEWYENKALDWKKLDNEVKEWESSSKQVIKDIRKREAFGLQKYGKALHKFTDEDMLQHLYEELLDASIYIKTLIEQRKMNATN